MNYLDKRYYNTEHLTPLSSYQKRVLRNIEEAEWLGDNIDAMQNEYDEIERMVKDGDVYYPNF
jgi:hypothetical protein